MLMNGVQSPSASGIASNARFPADARSAAADSAPRPTGGDRVDWSWLTGVSAAAGDTAAYGLSREQIQLLSARGEDAAAETAVTGADEPAFQFPAQPAMMPGAPTAPAETSDENGETGEADATDAEAEAQDNRSDGAGNELTEEERAQVDELKQRDAEVRRHEQTHLAAAGGYAKGGASYEYQRGPDGQSYAVGGEVSIDTSDAHTLEATITKMQTVQRAALAPADPSPQDRSVASQAAQRATQARAELAQQKREEASGAGQAQTPTGDASATSTTSAAAEGQERSTSAAATAGVMAGRLAQAYAASSAVPMAAARVA